MDRFKSEDAMITQTIDKVTCKKCKKEVDQICVPPDHGDIEVRCPECGDEIGILRATKPPEAAG